MGLGQVSIGRPLRQMRFLSAITCFPVYLSHRPLVSFFARVLPEWIDMEALVEKCHRNVMCVPFQTNPYTSAPNYSTLRYNISPPSLTTLYEVPTRETSQTTTPETTCLTFCDKCVGSLSSPANRVTLKMLETGPTIYITYPRRVELLTICRCNHK